MKRVVGLSAVMVFAAVTLTGCKSVSVLDQRLVSKPNMVFSDLSSYTWQSLLLTQVEPGSAMSGGNQAAGCTACQ